MSKLVDDLFKELDGYGYSADTTSEPKSSLDLNDLFAPIEEAFPSEERLRSEEYLEASEEESQYEEERLRKQREAEVQELAERGDIYAPKEEIEDLRAPIEFTKEEAGVITPSQDESNILTRTGAALADIKAGGAGLGTVFGGEGADFYASGKLFPPASGEEPGDPNYISAIRAENKRGREILRSLGRITGNTFDHSQFDFIRHIPTKESMDKIGEQLRELGKSEEQIESDLNDVRSFVARNEQLRRSMEQSHWNKVSEGLYSFDERVHDIYDRLDFVTKTLPQQSAPAEILKGLFEGTLEHDINSAIGWLAVSNPKKAKRLSDVFTLVKQEIDDNSVDHGKAVKFAKDLAKIIGPMTKTMAKGAAVGTVVPGFGAFATVPDWASAEAGGIFDESVRAGVPAEDAAAFAVGGGILSGMVEQLQVGRLKDIVSGVGKDRLKGIMLEGVKKYVKKKGAQAVLKFGKDFAKQTSQEALQKFVTEVAKEANIASAGLSEKDVFDMFASGGEAFVKEAVETAPHMAALTAISMLTGLGVSKARKMLNPRVNRSIQEALTEQDLDYTPENIARVLAEDPQLEERIKEQTTLKQTIESYRNFEYASKVTDKEATPGEIQRYWKTEYNVPITFETAKEKAETVKIINEYADFRSELDRIIKSDDIQNISDRMALLRENIPLLLEDKTTKFKPDTQRGPSREERRAEVEAGMYEEVETLKLLKNSLMSEGDKVTKKNVIKHWRDITGTKIKREEAKDLINLMEGLEVADAQEDQRIVDEVSPEERVEPRPEEEVRVRDIEQDREVAEPQAQEEIAPVEEAREEIVPVEEAQEEIAPVEEAVAPKEEEAVDGVIEESVIEDVIKPSKKKAVKTKRAKIDNPWDYVDEKDDYALSLGSDYDNLNNKGKKLLIKKLKDDIKTTIEDGFIDEGGNIILDDKSRSNLNLFFNKLTKAQNEIARETRDERKETEAVRNVRREEAFIESKEGLVGELSSEYKRIENDIIDVLKSDNLKEEWVLEGLNRGFEKDYSQDEVNKAIENVVNKDTGGEVESDIRRLFLENLTGVGHESTDKTIDQIRFIYGDTFDVEDRVFTEEELQEASKEDMFFSITKEGRVRPTKEELVVLEKAERDLEYFIPPDLLDKMVIERVDSIVADGEVVDNADGAIIQEADGTLKIKIDQDSSLADLARILYHEIMGHAGVANVINNKSKLHKEALRLFKSNEALPRVNELKETYKEVISNVRRRFGQQAADDLLFSEWMAHEMHDYMLNRDEQSIGAKLWALFKDWLVSKGWVEAKDTEEFMRVLTKEMRRVPPSQLSNNFHVKYQGPAVAFSLKSRVAGAKSKKKMIDEKRRESKSFKEFIQEVKKEARGEERAKKDVAVKKERQKKKEAVSKVREDKKTAVKKEKTAKKEAISKERKKTKAVKEKAKVEKKEIRETYKKEIKDLKAKHQEEMRELRRKINQQLRDQEIRIEEFHRTATEYAKIALDNKNDLNEFTAYLLRMRPRTKTGIAGAKNKTVKKLQNMLERKRLREAKKELVRLMKNLPKEMTAEKKKTVEDIIGNVQLSDLSKSKRLFLEAVKSLKDQGIEPSKELNEQLKRLDKIAVSKLEIDDIIDMIIALRVIIHESKEEQKEFVKNVKLDYQNLKEEVVSEIEAGRKPIEQAEGAIPSKAISKKTGLLGKTIDLTVGNLALTPDAVISERIVNKENSALQKAITGNIDNALTELLRFLQDIDRDFQSEVDLGHDELKNMSSIYYSGKGKREKALKNSGVDVKLPSGKTLTMTPAHRISFILHNMNEHNYESILREGVVFDTNIGGEISKLDAADVEAIVDSATDREKKIAAFFHKILNTKSREALLKTSKELQGYEMNLVDNYFPLHRTDIYKDYLLKGTSGTIGEQVLTHLESTGSLQERKKNAGGTVVIEDAFKTFYDSIKITGGYMAYAKPLRLSRRLLNDLEIEQARKYGIKDELSTLRRYLNDIEGNLAVKGDALETRLKRIYGNAAQAVLGINPIVILRQIPSYLTIGTTGIDPKHMMRGLGIGYRTDAYFDMLKKIEKYSPQIHQRITKGTVNAELGDRANMNEAARFFGKPKDIFEYQTAGIEFADKQVMVRIFNAAKSEVEENNPDLKGDEKWQKIAERAEYIIKETQPVYAKEHRSELGRSKSLVTRTLVAFTSVTNQLLKSYVKSYGRANRAGWTAKATSRFLQDFFWLNISATVAMVGIDELRDKIFGKQTTAADRAGRALKYFLAPIYFSGLATSATQDILKSFERGEFKPWNWDMASGNLLVGIPNDFLVGLVEVAQGIGRKDWETGDQARLIDGSVKMIDAVGKAVYGASVRNTVNYFIRPWTIKRGRPEVIGINKKLKFRPLIPRTVRYGPTKYKLVKDVYDDYVEAVHQFVQDMIDRYPNFENLTDKQKKEYLSRNYRVATRAMANYDMSDMVKIEEDE